MHNMEDEVLDRFFSESKEHLANVEDDILELEEQGDELDIELVNCIFRAIHAVKGGSTFFGLENLGDLAHHLEVVLDRIRRNELQVNADIISILLKGTDLINKMINDKDNLDTVNISEIDKNIEDLLAVALSDEEKEVSSSFVDVKFMSGEVIFSVNKYDFQRAVDEDKGGANVYLLRYDLIKDIEEKNKTPWEVISELLHICVFIDSKVDVGAIGTLDSDFPSTMPFYVLISTIIEPDLLCDFLDLAEDNIFRVGSDGIVGSIDENCGDNLVESIMDYLYPEFQEDRQDWSLSLKRDNISVSKESLNQLKHHLENMQQAKKYFNENCDCKNNDYVRNINIQVDHIEKIIAGILGDDDNGDNEEILADSSVDKLSIIVLNGAEQHYAVPMALVNRIEKISGNDIYVDNQKNYVDLQESKLELIDVCATMGMNRLSESDEYIVITLVFDDKEVGFIFNGLNSILNYRQSISHKKNYIAGVLGTIRINAIKVLLLDLYEILFMHYPQWDKKIEKSRVIDYKGILLVDSSEFFLSVIKSCLQRYGFVVFIAKNEAEAQEVLEEYGGDIRMVLADIGLLDNGLGKRLEVINEESDMNIKLVSTYSFIGEDKKTTEMPVSSEYDKSISKMDFYRLVEASLSVLEEGRSK